MNNIVVTLHLSGGRILQERFEALSEQDFDDIVDEWLGGGYGIGSAYVVRVTAHATHRADGHVRYELINDTK